jgi:hypothetical protein
MAQSNAEQYPLDARIFAERAARSVAEIQQHVSNLADVMVFLEVLGYTNELAIKNGFANLRELAKYVYEFLDYYEDDEEWNVSEMSLRPVASTGSRVLEGIGMAFPFVAAIVVLLLLGFSLWMAKILPLPVTTAFIAGIFLGILITEGPLQSFGRLFMFYYAQGNLGEARRVLGRSYAVFAVFSVTTSAILFSVAFIAHIPTILVAITAVSMMSIALHRTSYLLIYSLREIGTLVLSYTAALAILIITFYQTEAIITDVSLRYFISLGAAFLTLSIPAAYLQARISTMKTTSKSSKKAPNFYSVQKVGNLTVQSRFGIQLWEMVPFFVFGTFSFVMIFGDRVLSWIFNPAGFSPSFPLPMAFNPTYHDGADPALLVLMLTSIVAYVVIAPLYDELANFTARIRVSEVRQVERFLSRMYDKILGSTALTAVLVAALLNYEGPTIMSYLGASYISLQIFRVATISDIFLAIFLANAMFIVLVNKIKIAAVISMVCASIIIVGGTILGQFGFQNIIFAYFISSVVAMVTSTLYCKSLAGRMSRMYFARFV